MDKKELREYKIEDTIILGIDHGYGNIKIAYILLCIMSCTKL